MWSTLIRWHPLNCKRKSPGVAVLGDGRIVVVGGMGEGPVSCCLGTTEVYCPMLGCWTEGPSLNYPRHSAVCIVLPDDRILVVGGDDGCGGGVLECELVTVEPVFRYSDVSVSSGGGAVFVDVEKNRRCVWSTEAE